MKWSWKIARIAGIDVFIHATFVLLIAWLAIAAWMSERTFTAVVVGVAFPLALFTSVVLHEYGHALTARRYGIPTRDITLLPIGGVARLERMPDKPRQELLVALAGPAVNVVIALVLGLILLAVNGALPQLDLERGTFLERLLVVNIYLAVFNLIPAFPMDGGRVVRALLATRMEYTRATQLAASLGQGIALIFGFIGLFANPFLIFIALFVWIGAAQEASMVQMKSALSGIPVSRAMLTDFATLSPDDGIDRAVALILAGSQQEFPVLRDGQLAGILTRQGLMSWLSEHGQVGRVSEAMTGEVSSVDSYDMLDEVSARLQSQNTRTLAVKHDDRLVGLLTLDNLGEFVMIQSALKSAPNRRRTASM